MDEVQPPPQSNIRIRRDGRSAMTVEIPPAICTVPRRVARLAVTTALFAAAAFGGVPAARAAMPLPLRIAAVAVVGALGAIALLLLVALLNGFLRRISVRVDAENVTIADFWWILRWNTKTIPIRSIAKVYPMRFGHYSVLLRHREGGRDVVTTLASDIAEESEALWLAAEVRRVLPTS